MPTLTYRKLIKFGKSSFIMTLPKSWVDYYKLKPGDRLEVIANGELTVRPKRNHEKQKKY